MPSDLGAAARFEASLLLLAGMTTAHRVSARPGNDPWVPIEWAFRGNGLWVEYETELAAIRFAELMAAVPDVTCWTHQRVAGIRRQYSTFVVDVDGPTDVVVGWLRGGWSHSVASLLSGEAAAEPDLRLLAVAVWRAALLTAAPRLSPVRASLRAREPTSARLLVRAAQLLGMNYQTRTSRGCQVITVEGRAVAALTAIVHPLSQ